MQNLVIRTVGVIFAMCVIGGAPDARAATGFFKGEADQGLSKVCFYDVLGETHTLNIPSTKLCPLSYQFEVIPRMPAQPPAGPSGKTGFLKGEQEQGLTKICYYDVLGETYMITISSVKLCSLTYKFN
jgi:hypothetical protein